MVRPNWNGVAQNQRTKAQYRGEIVERSRVDRVPNETDSGCVICIVSLNIRSGQGGGVGDCAERTIAGQHWDRDLSGENISGGIQTRFSSGYKVWATEADIRHQGGVAIVWR